VARFGLQHCSKLLYLIVLSPAASGPQWDRMAVRRPHWTLGLAHDTVHTADCTGGTAASTSEGGCNSLAAAVAVTTEMAGAAAAAAAGDAGAARHAAQLSLAPHRGECWIMWLQRTPEASHCTPLHPHVSQT
jgi:hypothetical protein